MLTTIGRLAASAAVGALLSIGLAGSALGQDLEIRADGPDVSDSAAGADNVRVELNPGRQQAAASEGQGNQEILRAPRDDQEQQGNGRDRTRRGNSAGGDSGRENGGGGGGGGIAEAAPESGTAGGAETEPQAAAPVSDAVAAPRPVQLPSTGAGFAGSLPSLGLLLAAGLAAAGGWAMRRRA